MKKSLRKTRALHLTIVAIVIILAISVLVASHVYIRQSLLHGHKHYITDLKKIDEVTSSILQSIGHKKLNEIKKDIVEMKTRFHPNNEDHLSPKERRRKAFEIAVERRIHENSNRKTDDSKNYHQQQELIFRRAMRQQHQEFLANTSRKNKTSESRIVQIVEDFYSAIDSYFFCAFGFDEVRPFSCSGFNWPSMLMSEEQHPQPEIDQMDGFERNSMKNEAHLRKEVMLALFEEQKEQHFSHQEDLERNSGLMFTLIDGFTTSILFDDLVVKSSNLNKIMSFDFAPITKSRFFPQLDATQLKSKREKDLAATKLFSNVTIMSIASILEQLEKRWFLYNLRYLSLFELNIRILGSLLSSADLLESQHQDFYCVTACASNVLLEVAQDLRSLALKLGNSLLPAFSTDRNQNLKSAHVKGPNKTMIHPPLKYSFPQRYIRTSDSASSMAQSSLFNIAEVGTFDLEFEALSKVSGCKIFSVIATNIAGMIQELLPSQTGSDSKSLLKSSLFAAWSSINASADEGGKPMLKLVPLQGGKISLGALGDSYFEYRVKRQIYLKKNKGKKISQKCSMNSLKKIPRSDLSLSLELSTSSLSLENQEINNAALLGAISALMIDCSNQNNNTSSERCYISELEPPSSNFAFFETPPNFNAVTKIPRMSHLSCFAGGMFVLQSFQSFSSSDDEKYRFKYTIPYGVARACSDMSKKTQQGVAGEIYSIEENGTSMKLLYSAPEKRDENEITTSKNEEKENNDNDDDDENDSDAAVAAKKSILSEVDQSQPHLLRPEALESMFYSMMVNPERRGVKINWGGGKPGPSTSDLHDWDMIEQGWRIYSSMRRLCRSPKSGGWSSLKGLSPKKTRSRNGTIRFAMENYLDVMPSYFLAETFKYSLMIQVMGHSTALCSYEKIENSALFLQVFCGVGQGKNWIMNTEAHPFKM